MKTSQVIQFPTYYNSILDRIEEVNPIEYAETRNYTDGAVTYLSPYISRGVISIKQVLNSIQTKGLENALTTKLVQELAWREYFQRVWQAKGVSITQDLNQLQYDVQHNQMVSSIEDATTGIVEIDRLIEEFYNTGYLHNHVRMYIASLCCNVAKANWFIPSKWMYYHLLDGDVASNSCSWQWVAGSFSSKKYYCNQENVNHYTNTLQRNTYLDTDYASLTKKAIPNALANTKGLHLQTSTYGIRPDHFKGAPRFCSLSWY